MKLVSVHRPVDRKINASSFSFINTEKKYGLAMIQSHFEEEDGDTSQHVGIFFQRVEKGIGNNKNSLQKKSEGQQRSGERKGKSI